jgi:hypothetical protein
MLQFGSVRMGRLHHDVAPASRLGASSAIWLTKYAMPAERYARGDHRRPLPGRGAPTASASPPHSSPLNWHASEAKKGRLRRDGLERACESIGGTRNGVLSYAGLGWQYRCLEIMPLYAVFIQRGRNFTACELVLIKILQRAPRAGRWVGTQQ